MDLIRAILLELEQAPYDESWKTVLIDGRTDVEINYHVLLLDEAGLIEAKIIPVGNTKKCFPIRLTNRGHEFLDAAKSEKVWTKAKEYLLRTVGTLTVEGLKTALPHIVKTLAQGALG
jgi:hypothetical protein